MISKYRKRHYELCYAFEWYKFYSALHQIHEVNHLDIKDRICTEALPIVWSQVISKVAEPQLWIVHMKTPWINSENEMNIFGRAIVKRFEEFNIVAKVQSKTNSTD